jgi:hypothetical protein
VEKLTGQSIEEYSETEEPTDGQHKKALAIILSAVIFGGAGFIQGSNLQREWEIEESDYGDELWFGGTGHGLITVGKWSSGGCKKEPLEWAELQAEARLIASARNLLAALVEAVEWDGHDEYGEPAVWLEQARAAIRKARGE